MNEIRILDLTEIRTDPTQPRKIFNEVKITELMQSIEENGQITPIIVNQDLSGKYIIVDGERRFRAISQSENIKTVEAIVREYTKEDTKATQLIANWDREDISLREKADALSKFVSDYYNGDRNAAAKKLGKDIRTISKILSVHSSHPDVINLVTNGYVSDYSVLPKLNNLRNNNEDEFNNFVDRLKKNEVGNIRKELKNNPNTKPKNKSNTKQKFPKHKPRSIVDVDINDNKIDKPVLQISDRDEMYQFNLSTEQARKLYDKLSNMYE